MTKERDLYIGEHTERTITCLQTTYNFCNEQLHELGIHQGARGLDIGSNQGLGIQRGKWSKYDLTASDCEIKYSRLAKQNLTDIPIAVLDGIRLPLPENSFDFVMMHQVIEHLNTEGQKKTLKEIMRVVKPKTGIAFVSTPNADSRPKWSRPYSCDHRKELSLDEFRRTLDDHFASVQIYGQRFLQQGLIGAVYQIARTSPLNNIYFKLLPRTMRLKMRDQLSVSQQAEVIKPITNGDVPRSLLAVCCGPKK